ncbi:MAG: DUF6894 family protein [Janthinobacterium lividum]
MLLFIHATDSTFHSRDEGAEYERAEDALAFGVGSAIALIAEEINRGKNSAAVEISVRLEDGTSVLRSVVSVSVARLFPNFSVVY